MKMLITEDWFSDAQVENLVRIFRRTQGLEGAICDIGVWQGKSTIHLANACYPEILFAVDTWQGSLGESPDHLTLVLARQRDVYVEFLQNVRNCSRGNIRIFKEELPCLH